MPRFSDHAWRPGLERLAAIASIKVIRCVADAQTAMARANRRNANDPLRQTVHDPITEAHSADRWKPISLAVPTLTVNTTDGYHPTLSTILSFIRDETLYPA